MNILIVGGSGGIGAALVDRFLSHRLTNTIYATYLTGQKITQSPKVKWHQVDITSEKDIRDLADNIPQLDVLINAIGILHDECNHPEKTINNFDPDFFQKNISINTTASILLAKYFCRPLKSSSISHFVALSARVGSIEDNKIGGWISYRCSKAALNMAIKTISLEWQFKNPNCCALAFHPGTTDTNFSKPYQKNVPENKLFKPEYVADQLIQLIENTTPSDTGKFYSFDGSEISW
ncbi:SDR family NAD(P)-dependent oxidoreductase [uncultured Oceanicoccus sp.]|uniref:SDR family NAD(P)-dependent oxidoreductase n=1 Tax=uncultured Oceanicoccus sp. TaxID=1706381 RepID=UPI0030D9A450